MKGYKAFNKDLTCRDMKYEIGEVYEIEESPICCVKGFHFCKNIADVYKFYPASDDTRICEVESLGEVVTDDDIKFCTNKIKITKEIKSKAKKHCNSNSSTCGDFNSGYCNSGNRNSGYCNSGNRNSGNLNSGDFNSGDFNSGNFNSGDFNSGYCNTTNAKVRIFNHDTDMDFDDEKIIRFKNILLSIPQSYTYSDFISENNMSEEEKERHPEYKTIGGFVKIIKAEVDKWKWWNEKISKEEKEFIESLPYYDEDVFFESTGIKKDKERSKNGNNND